MAPPPLLSDWLRGRTPEVPRPLLEALLKVDRRGAVADPVTLADLGCDAISRALRNPGRQRRAAFDLLAGDAFLTYACEAVVEETADPKAGLEALIHRMGARFP